VNPRDILQAVKAILVIDWPSKEVPETLARAGFQVVVRGGPGPTDYSSYELSNGEVIVRHTGSAPERVDLVYAFRPLSELPAVIATATSLGAKTLWTQSGLSAQDVKDPRGCWLPDQEFQAARKLTETAGLQFVIQPYIADIAREIRPAH